MNGDRFRDLCRGKNLQSMTEDYINFCREPSGTAKSSARFPNLAGFCRQFGLRHDDLLRLKKERPDLYDHLLFVLEDEALNFSVSSTLTAAYLKHRLGYGDREETVSVANGGEMRLIFEHDIEKDGL
ncbi:MAG: hypothetical protein E7640_05340 [Ruminococcaceae bacterium]|nr:hypothetical protein [Oscillospiraceae bacterium]